MKILHAAETMRGGVATVISHNIQYQAECINTKQVIVVGPLEHMSDLTLNTTVRLFTFTRSGRDVLSFFRFIKVFAKTVKSNCPDVVHLHSTFAGVFGRLVLLYLRIYGIRPRVVYCPHGWAFLIKGSPLKKNFYASIERIMFSFADKIICVSNYEIREAAKYGIKGNKIVKIYNGIKVVKPVSREQDLMELKIVFLGRLDYQKGFDVALEVMRRLEGKPYHMYVIGDAVHATIAPEARPNVTYKGWQTQAEVFKSLGNADLLLMPSRWEGFGLAAAEAAMQECPAIATNCCSLPEIIKDGETGFLVSPNDVDGIVRILENTPIATWRKLGMQAREHVLALFSLEKMALDTLRTYKM